MSWGLATETVAGKVSGSAAPSFRCWRLVAHNVPDYFIAIVYLLSISCDQNWYLLIPLGELELRLHQRIDLHCAVWDSIVI